MAEVLSPQANTQTTFYSAQRTKTPQYYIETTTATSPKLAPQSASTTSMLNFAANQIHPPHSHASLRGSAANTPPLSSRTSTSDLASLFSNAVNTTTPPSSIDSFSPQDYRSHSAEIESSDEDDFPQYDDDEEEERDDETLDQEDDASERGDDNEKDSTVETVSDSSLPTPTVNDDTAVRREPSQHVDYLSHDWKEEDVWSSWRHVVSRRKVYGQQSRLENAAWRTWTKNKYHLRTVSPETLNWLKESDVTWLYGPLKPGQTELFSSCEESASCAHISKNNSFIGHKKPILKKRSMSEVMLQKSISTSSLLKQAAASVQAQDNDIYKLDAITPDYVGSVTSTGPSSSNTASNVASPNTSGAQTPSESREKKHIRFDDTVEQCIAVEIKPDEYEDFMDDDRPGSSLSSNSSDEGLVMMHNSRKRPTLGPRQSGSKSGSRSSSHQGRRTIETLPSTTLKYRTDSPEVSELQQQQASKSWASRPRLSPSASQETLRPSRPSRNFLLGAGEDDDEEEASNEDASWSFGSSNPRSSLGASASSSSLSRREATALPHSRSSSSADVNRSPVAEKTEHRQLQAMQSEPGAYGLAGMRRTESGMFMPEDDEDDAIATGLLGRISETVNTARDIAHVIWNVGWRK